MANFKQYSRYFNSQIFHDRSNKRFLQLRASIILAPAEDDIYVTISQTYINRVDLLSNDIYGTPDLWWIICDCNNIQDPLKDLTIGSTLRIPSFDRILTFMQF
jgi:hypothetical protein